MARGAGNSQRRLAGSDRPRPCPRRRIRPSSGANTGAPGSRRLARGCDWIEPSTTPPPPSYLLGVRIRADDVVIAALAVRHQRQQISLRARRHEQPRLEAEYRRELFLQRIDRRVVALHVIAHLGGQHRRAHDVGRAGDGVGAEVDGGHGQRWRSTDERSVRTSRLRVQCHWEVPPECALTAHTNQDSNSSPRTRRLDAQRTARPRPGTRCKRNAESLRARAPRRLGIPDALAADCRCSSMQPVHRPLILRLLICQHCRYRESVLQNPERIAIDRACSKATRSWSLLDPARCTYC